MSTTDTQRQEQFEYKAEMRQLLHLLVNSLYTHSDVFLRELISNASDALNKVRFRTLTDRDIVDPEASLQITVRPNAENNTLTVEDTGIGMTHDDLVERLGTVASSGTQAFLEELKQAEQPSEELIGRFGVGFYSAFMVAEEITVETRHADPGSTAYRWRSDGEGTFSIEEIDREKRGTTITLKLKEDAQEFSEVARVKQVIRTYSNFVDFPIYVNDEKVNTVKALWHKPKGDITEEEVEEFYKFISNDYQAPLGYLHLQIEGRVNFRALLFIPASAPPRFFYDEDQHGVHLYSSKVFIQDDCTSLLPDYLRFVRGVVDTADLPLNVSREVTQSSPLMAKIKTILTKKLLSELEDWAEGDPEKYATFFENFGPFLKTGISTDFGNRDRLIELLRFESTMTDEGAYTSLKDYVRRMPSDQSEIYYLAGDDRTSVERDPNLEYFRKNDIEVLLLIDPVDVFTIPNLGEYDGTPFTSIEKADLDLKQEDTFKADALSDDEVNRLIIQFKEVLGDRVEDVIASKRLVDSAATLVVGKQGLDKQMERMMKIMDQNVPPSAKVLEINPSHPLIKNLSRIEQEGDHHDLLEEAIQQLYEGTLLLDGNLNQPAAFVARMTNLMVKATS